MDKAKCDVVLQLRRKIIEKNFKKMNKMQKEAVFHTEGPLLILAGAGSGKTTVLVNRIENIIKYGNAYCSDEIPCDITDSDIQKMTECVESDEDIDKLLLDKIAVNKARPWQILAITFTNKAAGELKDRLSAKLGSEGENIWASTFHSTCSRILRYHADRIGYTKHFTIYDTDDSKRLIKDCQKKLNIDDKLIPYKSVMSEISRAKDNLIEPKEYKKCAGGDFRLGKIAEIYDIYQKELIKADAMDFDDLLYNTVLLFKKCPDVLEQYQNKFRYILVDEYQDTNHVQYVFISMLADKYRNLCVVGDDDQSIYKFRGATIENILDFEKTYPDAKVIRLEQNYRSTQNILNAANSVIENNIKRKGKKLWTQNNEGKKIFMYTALNEHEEAKYISEVILDSVSKGAKYSDFAILYRMNSQSNTIEKVFVKSGIPYRIIGGHRFYERREIRDMIAYLSVISNPYDEIRLRRIINQPKRSIGDKTLSNAMQIASELGEGLIDIIRRADEFEELKRAATKLKNFACLIDELVEASKDDNVSLSELYRLILDKTDYVMYIMAEKDDSENRVENINELLSNIIKYEEDNGEDATLAGFLEEVSLMTDIDNYDTSADTVILMTLHSAKGLEFPVIFLPGFEEGIFPGIQAMYNQAEIEEERRLAYVGITRARKELYILNAEGRMIFGSTSRNKLSRFAREIPKECVEVVGSASWKKLEPGAINSLSLNEARQKTTNSARNFGQTQKAKKTCAIQLTVGDRVSHKTFGLGTVMSVVKMGNDSLVSIEFDNVGVKKLMANFANLQKA